MALHREGSTIVMKAINGDALCLKDHGDELRTTRLTVMQCGGECLGWQADGGGGEAVGSGTRGTPSEDPGSPGAGGRDGRCLGGWWSRLGGCAFLTTAAVQLVGGGVSFSCPILARHLLTSFNGTTPAEAGA